MLNAWPATGFCGMRSSAALARSEANQQAAMARANQDKFAHLLFLNACFLLILPVENCTGSQSRDSYERF